MEKPHYVIQFSAAQCMFEIRVNDIIVVTLNLEEQAMTIIPFNYAITDLGKQIITVRILPVFGEIHLRNTAEFYYDVLLYDVSNGFKLKENLGGYKAPKVDNSKPKTVLTNTYSIDATVPFKLNDSWKEGQDLKEVKDLYEKLRKTYSNIANIIESRNFDGLLKLMELKENNIQKALYLAKEDRNARMNSLIIDIKGGFNKIQIPNDCIIVYSSYNKIASLKRANGEPALSLMNLEINEELMLDLDFYLPKNSSQFQII
ncbi:hypothetical protein [Cellulophaga baltica]|uniref:DUF4369 domain-containing protein n=1 Tax=Cellulophaga baltica 18 TaxID=1348584 RepID=A0AAU8S051_9FLAO|nr:hypothetical protein [Cellulophaga baltica]AIZ42794.1 hypothetical protein M666_15160 [Cellulophaga baltica 18]